MQIKHIQSALFYEFRSKWRQTLIWIVVWLLMSLLIASFFESLQSQLAETNFLEALPEELRASFNITEDYLSSVEDYVSGEFITFYALVSAIFGVIYGVNQIGGKIADKSIQIPLSIGISRINYYFTIIITGVVNIFFKNIVIGISNFYLFTWLTVDDEINFNFFLYSFIALAILEIFWVILGMFISLLLDRGIAISVGSGIAVVSWFVDSLSSLNDFPEWISWFSPFHYLGLEHLVDEFQPDILLLSILVLIIITVSSICGFIFTKKDIYL